MGTDRENFVKSLRIDNRKKIKNQPSKSKFTTRVAAGLIAGLLAMGGLTACNSNQKNITENDIPTVSTTMQPNKKESLEDRVKAVEKEFLDDYIKAYNEKYGTDYKSSELEFVTNWLQGGYVFVVNDKMVTRGQYPQIVKQELSKIGEVTAEDGHDKIIQILAERGNETTILGTYDALTLESMYSGLELEKINDELPEFEKLRIDKSVVRAITELEFAKGHEEKESIEQRLDKYEEAKNKNKGYEIGD